MGNPNYCPIAPAGEHEWIPFGLKRYNTDGLNRPTFYRVEDVRCLLCGDVRPVRGEGSLQRSMQEVLGDDA